VARALAAAEACGVMHRDLKPSNIMLTTHQGEKIGGASAIVKVIDWGLAKAVSAESALGVDHTHGGFVGTPAFASPEQFSRLEERRVDTRSDIYSLRVTLWYMLCGRTPFMGSTLEEIHSRQVQNPIPLDQLSAARVPARIVTLLKAMLAVDPAARPQSARELLDALRDCQEQFPFETVSRHARGRQFRRVAVVTGLLLVLAVCGLVWWEFTRRAPSTPADRSIAVRCRAKSRAPSPTGWMSCSWEVKKSPSMNRPPATWPRTISTCAPARCRGR
jgi:serine/threonine protein kinase